MRLRPLALLLLTAASCGSPPGQRRPQTGEFQPLEVGLQWTYSVDGRTQIRKVLGVENVGRFECHVIEATGDVVGKWWLRSDRGGLRLYRAWDGIETVEFDDPLILIPPQATPGATWNFEEQQGPMTLAVEGRYERDEDVHVDDRVLTCARFRLIKRAAGRLVLDQTSWYARDVGLVRLRLFVAGEAGDERTSLQLVSSNFVSEGVEPGAPRRR